MSMTAPPASLVARLEQFHDPRLERLPEWLEQFAARLDAHQESADLFMQEVVGLRSWAEIVRLRLSQRDAEIAQVVKAAKGVLAQFEAISRRQHDLLVRGQTLESASENWDEATMGQFIDFQPLMDAVSALTATSQERE